MSLVRGPSLEEGHAQGGADEAGIEALMHGPTHHAAGAEIEDGDQIQPALASQDAGRIGHPDLIRPMHGQALETVRRDRSAVLAVGRGARDIWSVAGRRGAPARMSRAMRLRRPGQPKAWANRGLP